MIHVWKAGRVTFMNILQLLGNSSNEHSLGLASKAEIAALQKLVVEKGDKAYLRCPVRQKDILAKPDPKPTACPPILLPM